MFAIQLAARYCLQSITQSRFHDDRTRIAVMIRTCPHCQLPVPHAASRNCPQCGRSLPAAPILPAALDHVFADDWPDAGVAPMPASASPEPPSVDPRTLFHEGMSQLARRQFTEAIVSFSGALQSDSRMAAAWAGRGQARLALRDIARALADFDQAVTLDPNSSAYHNLRGMSYLAQTELDKAGADFERAIQLDRRNSMAHHNLGYIFLQKKMPDEALAAFDTAL